MTRILVTGGAGFIGSHVVDSLLRNPAHEVVVLDDLSGGFMENVNPEAKLVAGSVCDARLVDSVFEGFKFDYVFHLAAYAAEGLSHFIRNFNYTNNLLGSVNLINASARHEVKCFVFTSSIAVYGSITAPMREYDTPRPEDPYGISKYAVEMDLRSARKMFNLPYIIFRIHNVYGERQNIGDPYRNVIGIFMNRILQGLPMQIFGDGLQRRAFTHVSDVAPVIASSVYNLDARDKIFNLGSDIPCTVNELAHMTAQAMGQGDWPVEHLEARNEVKAAYCDHSRASVVLRVQPQVSLRNGLVGMAAWACSVGARQGKPFEGVEVERNLPPSWRKVLA